MRPFVFLSENQVNTMFDLQHKCNQLLIAPDYLENPSENVDFDLAADKEYFEALDHLSYKWWKKDTNDVDQVALEMIDVIHFCISRCIEIHHERTDLHGRFPTAASQFNAFVEGTKESVLENVENVVNLAAQQQHSSDQTALGLIGGYRLPFITDHAANKINFALIILHFCNYDANDLFNLYVAKNALNIFRAQNGYKDGSYIKMWNGREDNSYVEAFVKANDMSQPDAVDQLNAYLTSEYALVKASA